MTRHSGRKTLPRAREGERKRESLEKDHIAVDVRDLSLIDRVFSLKTELGALHIFAFHNDMG